MKITPLFIPLLFIMMNVSGQNDTRTRPALLIIDIQQFYFPSGENPGLVNAQVASMKAKEVLSIFRDNRQTVVHVKHLASKGSDIYENVSPLSNEKVITKEEVNCFNGTDLYDYLKKEQITRLVIIGMQTHMCLEAAVRAAYDLGFECVVVEDACATKDLRFGDKIARAEDVHLSTLATIQNGGYGQVINLENFKQNTEKILFEVFR